MTPRNSSMFHKFPPKLGYVKIIQKNFKNSLCFLIPLDIINLVLKKWLLGQAVKTPPFHGGNTGSSPVGVTISGLVV